MFAYILIIIGLLQIPFVYASATNNTLPFNTTPTAILNQSTYTQTTTVPIAYRAIVGIILVVIVVLAVWKFLKLFIGGIIALVILLIIASTAYYFFYTGTLSLQNSFAFLSYVWQFFLGKISFIGTATNVLNSTNINVPVK
jgi:hypothetical protein